MDRTANLEKTMTTDIKLTLIEDDLPGEMIRLEGEGYDQDNYDRYRLIGDYTDLMIWVRRDDQIVILIELDRFRNLTGTAVQELRDNPLPWTFTVESLGISGKPLEEVILAAWEKYRGIKMEWE